MVGECSSNSYRECVERFRFNRNYFCLIRSVLRCVFYPLLWLISESATALMLRGLQAITRIFKSNACLHEDGLSALSV